MIDTTDASGSDHMTGWDFTGIHSSKEYRDMEKNHVETEGPLWWIYGGKYGKV